MGLAGRISRKVATRTAAFASVAMLLTGCMTVEQARTAQQPALPRNHSVAWSPENRLYQSVTLDYIGGMDQRSYVFGKANQAAFRPMLEHVLAETGMLAPTPLAARYALRVEFKQLEGNTIGADFTSSSVAVYRIVNRSTGETVFEREVPAQFTAIFPGMNEHDLEHVYQRLPESTGYLALASAAYGVSKWHHESSLFSGNIPFDGYDIKYNVIQGSGLSPAAHTAMIKLYQASIAAALFNEASAGLDAFKLWNFVAFLNFSGSPPHEPVLGAARGALSESGIGARDGTERGKQADFMMMEQSLTKLVIGLSDAEHVQFTTRLPCTSNAEVEAMKSYLMASNMPWETDDCMQYQQPFPHGRGLTYSSAR